MLSDDNRKTLSLLYTKGEILSKKEQPYTKFYNHILQDANLDFAERGVYNLIYNFTIDGKACYASNQFISKELALDITKVKRALKSLVDKKYITITKYSKGKIKRSINRYDIATVMSAEKGVFEGCSWHLIYKL